MAAAAPPTPAADPAAAFDRAAGPALAVLDLAGAESILTFRPDPAVVARIAELSTKARGGDLTADERAELTAYLDADSFISVLQGQLERRLAARG